MHPILDPRAVREIRRTDGRPLLHPEPPESTRPPRRRPKQTRWRAPSWSATLGATVLRLDIPIRIDATFAVVLSQAVTLFELSQHIASATASESTPAGS